MLMVSTKFQQNLWLKEKKKAMWTGVLPAQKGNIVKKIT